MSETPGSAPLAEQEGVDAASADSADEGGPRETASVTKGGHPEDAPDHSGGLTGYGATEDDEELVGTPDEASEEHQSSGQDSGSMD